MGIDLEIRIQPDSDAAGRKLTTASRSEGSKPARVFGEPIRRLAKKGNVLPGRGQSVYERILTRRWNAAPAVVSSHQGEDDKQRGKNKKRVFMIFRAYFADDH
jgi:hypothetical protein